MGSAFGEIRWLQAYGVCHYVCKFPFPGMNRENKVEKLAIQAQTASKHANVFQ